MELVMLQTIVNGFVLGFIASPSCPSNAEEIRLGTRYHAGYALLVGVGAVTGDVIVLGAVLLGLVPLLEAYPFLNSSLLLIGSAVLFYVSWGIFKEAMNISGWTTLFLAAMQELERLCKIGNKSSYTISLDQSEVREIDKQG
jgi:threonine/homoserine/homoserine lactone efflux protein